jgi:ribonucleoside-diphosphate reductase beta chain
VRSDEVHGFAFQALTRRLKVIGVALAPAEDEAVPA